MIPVGITYLANFTLASSNIYGSLGSGRVLCFLLNFLAVRNFLIFCVFSVMGHEFSHGFDTTGAVYNNEGNAEGNFRVLN